VSPGASRTLYLKLALTAAAWGGQFVAGRVLAQSMPHLVAAAGRYVLASACLLAVTLWQEGRLPVPPRPQLWGTALLGLTGMFLFNLFFFGALARLPASRAALIVALNPASTALLVALFFRERLSPLRWLGIGVAFLGVAIALSRGRVWALFSSGLGAGEALMLGGTIAWAAYTVLGRAVLRSLSPLAATTWASLWGTLWLSLGAAAQWRGFSMAQLGLANLGAMAYLGVVGTAVAFVWYYQGVRAIGPTRSAVFNNLVPIFGMTSGVLVLGEPLHASMVVGGLVALAGVTLVNLPSRR